MPTLIAYEPQNVYPARKPSAGSFCLIAINTSWSADRSSVWFEEYVFSAWRLRETVRADTQ